MNYGKYKFYVVCYYSDLDMPSECFRPTSTTFENIQDCFVWIDKHKKYFSPLVRFGVFPYDNTFESIIEVKPFDGLK